MWEVMNLRLSLVLAGALAVGVHAQDAALNTAPSGKPRQNLEIAAPLAPKTNAIDTNVLSSARGPKLPKEPTVSYGGVVNDIRKSTNRWRMFSLRRHANLKEDEANMVRNLRTEASPAVKLISVDF